MDKAQKLMNNASFIYDRQNTFRFCSYNAFSLCDDRSEYKKLEET